MADLSEVDMEKDYEKDDFRDPLGAKDPLSGALVDDIDDVEFDIEPIKSSELDAMLAQNSTRLTSLTLDDDLDAETNDMFVVVDNPEKHTTTMESYITFRITTKTTRSEFDSHEYQVRRRYNDFLWLRQRLEETQPTHLVPPLPEKHSLRQFDRFSTEFVKTRQAGLQIFLQRIADHPVLSFNKYYVTFLIAKQSPLPKKHTLSQLDRFQSKFVEERQIGLQAFMQRVAEHPTLSYNSTFQKFLTAKQSEFQAAKKEGSGFISRMADSFHNMSASYMMKNRSPEFTMMNEYTTAFSEKLGTMDRISQRILKEQTEYLQEVNEWGPVFTLWSNSEDKLAQALRAMAKSVEKCFLSLQELVDATETEFSQPIREYMLYTEAIKGVLRRRDAIQMEYEMTHEELNRKKDEREQQPVEEVKISDQSNSLGAWMGKDPEEVKQLKQEKISLYIEELTSQVEVLNDKTVCANADLKADMERWHKNKRRDFKKLFMALADRQIKYYESCIQAWEEAIPLMQKTDRVSDSDLEVALGRD